MSASSPPFSKILVANRGEIAVRIMRTCRERGIRTVAIYSDGDRDARHTLEADEAVHVGPTPSADSYLRTDRVIEAARATGAQAIHPGYGFLSERVELVDACERAAITFIGPRSHALYVMGDKLRSRQAMIAAGVPVVPGHDELASPGAAVEAARDIGLPVMLKASAGGGGKGMRIVTRAQDVERAFEAASREALAAFGDGRLFMERAVMTARHVEIQVMADRHGHCVHLCERDCSVQRRHQKVIEEAPSPSPQMTPALREAMGAVAVQAARAVDYVGAGTVEFLFEETAEGPRFYFLEMNTRLQVEHPVTEAITRRDLVWDMIRVAGGEPLGYAQHEVEPQGHAIECRIYAEDPVRFLPSPGTLTRLRWPEGAGLRVDAAVHEGSDVSSHYDPMIAKLIAWAPTRAEAIARMRRAVEETVCLGIATNLPFHARVLSEPDFLAGRFSTRYIEEHADALRPATAAAEDAAAVAAAAACAAVVRASSPGVSAGAPSAEVASPWWSSAAWRS